MPHEESWFIGEVEEVDGESECVDEPLLNWKTRDCDTTELSVLLRWGFCGPLFMLRMLALLSERVLLAAGLKPETGDCTSDALAVFDGLNV